MCRQYSLITKPKLLESIFQIDASTIENKFEPNVNISPREYAPVITNTKPDQLQLFTFGYTPYWAKQPMEIPNARSEGDHNPDNDPQYAGAKGILNKPMFRKSIRSQRCLVLADGFIVGPGSAAPGQPHFVYASKDKRPMALAGIWDQWQDPANGKISYSFAILTTTANALLQKMGHNRSPVVLRSVDERRWLRNDLALRDITHLLRPFSPTNYNAYPIAPQILNPINKNPNLLQPIGVPIKKEFNYHFYKKMELQGMGETSARKRRKEEPRGLVSGTRYQVPGDEKQKPDT